MSSQATIDVDEPYRWIPDHPDEFVSPEVEFDAWEEDLDTTTGDPYEGRTHPHESDDRDVNGRGVFKHEIQRDPEICSCCFRKNYDVIFPWTERRSGPDGTVRYFVPAGGSTESVPQAGQEARNPPRACKCGRIGALRERPLPKSRAIEYAWELSKTLTQKGIKHDPLLLAATVTQRKMIRPSASRDDQNFDIATARSLDSYHYEWDDYLRPQITQPQLPPADD